MKILISILACEGDGHYVALEKAIRETWGSGKSEHEDIVDIIYYYGNPSLESDFKLEGDRLWVKSPEGYFNTWNKTLMMFDFISKNYQFDCLFRTNLSAYIDLEILQDFAKKNYNDNFYCGCHGNLDPTGPTELLRAAKFASGAGYFLSHKLVKELADEKESLFKEYIDDLSLGECMMKKNISPHLGERYGAEGSFDDVSNKLTKTSSRGGADHPEGTGSDGGRGTIFHDIDHYHYRLHTTEGNRSDDIKKMHFIHELKNKR
jgi:hypothetical protein